MAEQDETVLQGRLRELQRAEVLFPRPGLDPECVFNHASLREVAYNTLLVRRRCALHLAARAICALYPGDEYAEVIAYHYRQTEEHAEAAKWLERAGDRAAASYANSIALDHYAAAISIGNLADCALLRGSYAEADDLARRAEGIYERIGSQDGLGSARRIRGEVAHARGHLWEADDLLRRSVEVQEPLGMPLDLLVAQVVRAAAAADRGQLSTALSIARETRRQVAHRDAYEPAALAAVVHARVLLSQLPLTPRRSRVVESLLAFAADAAVQRVGIRLSLTIALAFGELHRARGDAVGARAAGQEALERAVASGMPREEGMARRMLGRVAAVQGQCAEAESHLDASEAILEAIGAELELARSRVALADLLRLQPEASPDEVRALLAAAHRAFVECGAALDLHRIEFHPRDVDSDLAASGAIG